jgi:alpha-1,6-mannosyltransferase
MERPERERRLAARSRAERFGWPQAVDGFLRAHGLSAATAGAGAAIARQHKPVTTLRPAFPATPGVGAG